MSNAQRDLLFVVVAAELVHVHDELLDAAQQVGLELGLDGDQVRLYALGLNTVELKKSIA